MSEPISRKWHPTSPFWVLHLRKGLPLNPATVRYPRPHATDPCSYRCPPRLQGRFQRSRPGLSGTMFRVCALCVRGFQKREGHGRLVGQVPGPDSGHPCNTGQPGQDHDFRGLCRLVGCAPRPGRPAHCRPPEDGGYIERALAHWPAFTAFSTAISTRGLMRI